MSTFVPAWLKSAVFIDGVIFGISYFFTSSPLNIIFDVGIYSSAFAIVGMFAIIQTAFNVVWRPLQTEHYSHENDDRSFIRDGNRYMTIIMFFGGLSIILLKDVFCLFLGESYRAGAKLIPFLIFNPIMNTLISTVTSGIEHSKKGHLRVFIILISLLVELIMSKLLIPYFGIYAIAISMSVSLIVQYILTVLISEKYYKVNYKLGKSLVLIVVTFIYAIISCKYNILLVNIAAYVAAIITLFIIYKNEIKKMITFINISVSKKEWWYT